MLVVRGFGYVRERWGMEIGDSWFVIRGSGLGYVRVR